MCLDYVFFFFSSRRRHTRYWRDWSSDVCSSDLKAEHGSDYFDDLHRIHDSLGLGIPAEEGVRAFASLSPIKEKELIVIAHSPQDASLHRTVGALLEGYVRTLAVQTFNVAFYMPPLVPAGE